MELHGWLTAKNCNISCLGEPVDLGSCVQYNNFLDKFPDDRVFIYDDKQITFLDGYIHNKSDFIKENGKSEWRKNFAAEIGKGTGECLNKLRGGFCGYVYDKLSALLTVYTDQTSNRAIYYYARDDKWIVSNYLDFIVRVLKANDIQYHFDATAAKYMLTYGFMLDSSTYIEEIKRVLPGNFVKIQSGKISVTPYYSIRYSEEKMSREEAVERIDTAFRRAIAREFEKDKEYGYKHLVDLSGGLDSRMVCWVAHDMGYTDQLNITYSQTGYTDQTVSQKIAKNLGHEYLFKALDDAKWMYDVDEMTLKSNGAACYMAMTGGNRFLKSLRSDAYGIEHTGMVGDVIISTFYHDKAFSYSSPQYGYNRYSERLSYDFKETLLQDYSTQELFAIYTRGILGAQTSYMIRQNYVATSSPFLDVDFLNVVFSIPFEYRSGHSIYLEWIAKKYPKAAHYGWEKWGGIKPQKSHIFFRKIKTAQRLLNIYFCKWFHKPNRDTMNPEDYWYERNPDIQQYMRKMFDERISNDILDDGIREDMRQLFEKGNITDKSLALTVLSAIYLYF